MKKKYLTEQADFLLEALLKNGFIYTGEEGLTIPKDVIDGIKANLIDINLYFEKCKVASVEAIKIRDLIFSAIIGYDGKTSNKINLELDRLKSKLKSAVLKSIKGVLKSNGSSDSNTELILMKNEIDPAIQESIKISLHQFGVLITKLASREVVENNVASVVSISRPSPLLLSDVNITDTIESVLKENQAEFERTIREIHKKSGLKQFEVSRISGIHETTLSKIFNGKKRDITRDMLIRLAISYRLTIKETNELLMKKGYFLCADNERNLIITLGIEQRCKIDDIEELLYERGLQTLSQVS